MPESTRTYLPAAGHDWSLPLYDPIVNLLGGDKARKAILDQAALRPGQRVLDIGCGTGHSLPSSSVFIRMSRWLNRSRPEPSPAPDVKQRRAAVSIQFDQGFGDDLPYADASFDRVSRRSCSTIFRPAKRARHCVQSDASSNRTVSSTYSILKGLRTVTTPSWLGCFTRVTG